MPIESRLNNTRPILAAVLIAALATAAAAAEHGESKPAAHSGDGGAHDTAGPAGRAGSKMGTAALQFRFGRLVG